ncbi:unnamed protein product [Nippostrongylus brasiliensis]|uniref:EGF-like domain-containing protein n=1 Tax=Nippostrongylus brasiliensis TaxID=27835 RepID=A0A0N4YEC9_NIPBR|nr:unnamed protein product [Nippostrongylus brasiliensis]
MSVHIRSIDHSFCLARCSESGICYKTEDGPMCYCYDGNFGGTCSLEDGRVSDAPTGAEGGIELCHLVAGFIVVICEIVWFCYCRRRMTGVPRVVAVDVELSDETDSWSVLDSDDLEEFDQSELLAIFACPTRGW